LHNQKSRVERGFSSIKERITAIRSSQRRQRE
jgi:hypothetical protein